MVEISEFEADREKRYVSDESYELDNDPEKARFVFNLLRILCGAELADKTMTQFSADV